ncbi:MAG: DUF5677 domain-containing protein [Anaeromicrobium sp.]|uniref:DUF5677 domain-containing protein n=1 Tax=Anaeromicrobium sp. TaxID=1929132 RepID=UPI0025D02FDD|nr:DUF5677 domain-containing protein [Anaeromicrobium sp.]MCT4594194.1 DUF5677 domain-containing protein [Anaeromicrobium sp.]
MPFKINGYLGKQVEGILEDNYTNHKQVFKTCEEINRYAQQLKSKFNINSLDRQGVFSTILYLKIHNAFQGAVIMYKHGLNSEAKVITRTGLEFLFILKAIVKDEKNCDKLFEADDKNRELLLKNINYDKNNIFSELANKVDLRDYYKLKSKNKDNNVKKLKIKQWAELSDSLIDYNYAYYYLCGEVHVDLRSFEKYVETDEEGQITQFNPLPSTKDINLIMFTASHCMLGAIEAMSRLKKFDNEHEIKEISDLVLSIKDMDIEIE